MIEFLWMRNRAVGTQSARRPLKRDGKSFAAMSSVPAAATVKASTTKHDQNDEDDQKSVGIHWNSPEPNRTGKLVRLRYFVRRTLSSSCR